MLEGAPEDDERDRKVEKLEKGFGLGGGGDWVFENEVRVGIE